MKQNIEKIGLGGGCHWCTEAVFQVLKGVVEVEQGYIASENPDSNYSEAVIVHYIPEEISLEVLLRIHLHTHNSTKDHSMRDKYRSAVYCFSKEQLSAVEGVLKMLQIEFDEELVTRSLLFRKFKASRIEIQDYYKTDPSRPFCKRFIDPKLKLLQEKFIEQL